MAVLLGEDETVFTKEVNVDHKQEQTSQILLQMIEQMTSYCHYLITSRQRVELGVLNHRETMTHLRSVFDESTMRERKHIETLVHFPKILKVLDQLYYRLKTKAKVLIKECLDDKLKQYQNYEAALTEFQKIEAELFAAQSFLRSQSIDLASLEEAMKLHRTGAEIHQLEAELKRLEDENQKLADEKLNLTTTIDKLNEQLQIAHGEKALCDSGSNSQIAGDFILDSARNTTDMQKVAEDLFQLIETEKIQYEETLKKEKAETLQLKRDAERLINLVEEKTAS